MISRESGVVINALLNDGDFHTQFVRTIEDLSNELFTKPQFILGCQSILNLFSALRS